MVVQYNNSSVPEQSVFFAGTACLYGRSITLCNNVCNDVCNNVGDTLCNTVGNNIDLAFRIVNAFTIYSITRCKCAFRVAAVSFTQVNVALLPRYKRAMWRFCDCA